MPSLTSFAARPGRSELFRRRLRRYRARTVGSGMAEAVAAAGAEDRHTGPRPGPTPRCSRSGCRGAAPSRSRSGAGATRGEAALHGLADVAGQDDRDSRQRSSRTMRIVVADALAFPVGGAGAGRSSHRRATMRSPAWTFAHHADAPAARRAARSAARSGGTGMPSQTSRGRNSRTIAARRRCDRGRRA